MRQKSETVGTSEQVVKDIRPVTRKQQAAEEKIPVVPNGFATHSACFGW